jgi:basic membrane protein A
LSDWTNKSACSGAQNDHESTFEITKTSNKTLNIKGDTMKPLAKLTASALASILAAGMSFGVAQAADITPAVVFDMGGKFDKSFNEGVYNGVEKFRKETGIKYKEFEVSNETQREQAIRRMAQRGANPVLGIGFAQAPAIKKVAKEFPNTKFAIIDMVVDLPNVKSIVFKEHEGSFLVGALAALASKTGKVGFVGGMDIGLIRKFACGYAQGAKHVNAKIEVIQNMTGTTPSAWNNPTKGGELARSQFDRGADVVYAAAGGTGIGVYQAAKDAGKLAIGVDSNQNHLQPGTMLTSMLKRVDVAAYNVFMSAKNGTWKSGIEVLGLAQDGVGWALDKHNAKLVSGDMKARVEQIRKDIIAGKIKVHDYNDNKKCPV